MNEAKTLLNYEKRIRECMIPRLHELEGAYLSTFSVFSTEKECCNHLSNNAFVLMKIAREHGVHVKAVTSECKVGGHYRAPLLDGDTRASAKIVYVGNTTTSRSTPRQIGPLPLRTRCSMDYNDWSTWLLLFGQVRQPWSSLTILKIYTVYFLQPALRAVGGNQLLGQPAPALLAQPGSRRAVHGPPPARHALAVAAGLQGHGPPHGAAHPGRGGRGMRGYLLRDSR